jgi:hypothetical protein
MPFHGLGERIKLRLSVRNASFMKEAVPNDTMDEIDKIRRTEE